MLLVLLLAVWRCLPMLVLPVVLPELMLLAALRYLPQLPLPMAQLERMLMPWPSL